MSVDDAYPSEVVQFALDELDDPHCLNCPGIMELRGVTETAAKQFVRQVKGYLWDSRKLRYGHDPDINAYRIMPTNTIIAKRMISYDIGHAASQTDDAAMSVRGGVARGVVDAEAGNAAAIKLTRLGADIADVSEEIEYV